MAMIDLWIWIWIWCTHLVKNDVISGIPIYKGLRILSAVHFT